MNKSMNPKIRKLLSEDEFAEQLIGVTHYFFFGRLKRLKLLFHLVDMFNIDLISFERNFNGLIKLFYFLICKIKFILELVPNLSSFWVRDLNLLISWENKTNSLKDILNNRMFCAHFLPQILVIL